MSEYKLVPFPPTPEMVKAARDSYMRFGYMELAIRAALLAAPAVQGEPTIDPYDAGSLNDFGGGDVGWWHGYIRAELDRAYEFYLMQLASAPQPAPQPAEQQPAPDVPGLTEALRQYQHNDGSGLVFGYDKLLVDQYVAQLVEALEALLEVRVVEADASYGLACAKAEQALAAHHKQGGEA